MGQTMNQNNTSSAPAFDVVAPKSGLRDPQLKKAFAEAVAGYNARSSAFFAPNGSPAAMNSAATMFWRGFNDVRCAYRERANDGTFAYAYWKAGKAVRAALQQQAAA
jgi:hypothetical protein